METFKELKHHLNSLGVRRIDSSVKERNSCIIKNCVVLGVLILLFVTTAWFRAFSAQSISEKSESSCAALAALLHIAWYSTLIWHREKYAAIIAELDAKIEQRLSDTSVEAIYRKTNEKIEFLTKNLFLISQIILGLYSLFPVIVSIFKYVSSGYSNEFFEPIYPASYPFDRKSPIGYFVCVIIQVSSIFIVIENYCCVITLAIGFCLFISDLARDLSVKIQQINKDIIEMGENGPTATEEIWLKRKFVEFVQLHSDAREFAIRFSDLNQAIVFACPAFTIAVFGSLLLQSKTILGSGDPIAIAQSLVIIFFTLFPFFLLCHFGGNVTYEFENLGNDLYELEWYNLPIEMQKQLPIIIASTQKRIYIRGYGDTRSTHSVFKQILRNKFFYFVLVSQL